MIKKIRQTFAKKPSKKFRSAAIIALVLVCSFAFMVVASAVSVYKVTTHDSTNTIDISKRKSAPLEIMTQTEPARGKYDLTQTSVFVESTVPQLTIDRAIGVTVVADSKAIDFHTMPGTVSDAITKAKIELGKDDVTVPNLEKQLTDGMKISIIRVEYEQRVEKETIKFERKTVKTDDLYVGQSKLSSSGVNGEKSVTYQDKIVNGIFDETTVASEKITKEPVDRVLLVGSKLKVNKNAIKSGVSPISDLTPPADLKLDENGLPLDYKKVIEGTSTAYSGGGTTATGRPAMEGYIAVDPEQIPYGTKLYIVSADGRYVYGYCIAADTGGFAQKHQCTTDIYMNTEYECVQFGRRAVRIFVL